MKNITFPDFFLCHQVPSDHDTCRIISTWDVSHTSFGPIWSLFLILCGCTRYAIFRPKYFKNEKNNISRFFICHQVPLEHDSCKMVSMYLVSHISEFAAEIYSFFIVGHIGGPIQGGPPMLKILRCRFYFKMDLYLYLMSQKIFFRHVNTVFSLPQILIFIARI